MTDLRRRQLLKGSVAWATTGWTAAAQAKTAAKPPGAAPSEVASELPDALLLGSGRLTFLGLHVYDARLWAPATFMAANFGGAPLALELQYARNLSGKLIADRSLVEMRKVAEVPQALGETWLEQMRSAFPDVKKGDRITGVQRPGDATRVYFNGQPRGEIKDAEFTKAFFSIWLSPRTSEPALRIALLGAKAVP